MIHGCRIGVGSVIEPGAIVCDSSVLGAECIVRAGAVVKQRSHFPSRTDIDGFPASDRGHLAEAPERPTWAWGSDDLPVLTTGPVR
jgi:carbonic anhydrase/acetyltransferase-like protein (isoleucine patch superfamily)